MSTKEIKEIEEDKLVSMLADPPNIQSSRRFFGLIGKAEQPTHINLYLTEGLEMYLVLRREDILATTKRTQSLAMTGFSEPIEGTDVWIRRGAPAELKFSDAAQRIASQFLQGELMSELLPDANAEALVMRIPDVSVNIPTWFICVISPAASIIIVASVSPRTKHHNS